MAAGSSQDIVFENRAIRMKGPLPQAEMQMLRAEVREGLSKITEIEVEFLSNKMDSSLEDVLGKVITIEIDTEKEGVRHFAGHCVEVLYEGVYQGFGHYLASLRAWPWFLTQTTDCRIFQEMTAMAIIKQIFGDHGFSDYQDKTGGGGATRTYCVQYRETDYDFVQRLMVEEGFYYYFDYADGKDTMVIVNDAGHHAPIRERSEIEFFFKEDSHRRRSDHIFDFRERESLRTGKVTLNDYNFETPTTDLKVSSAIPKGKHAHKSYERYDYPGRFGDTSRGEGLARTRMEAFAAEHDRVRGIGNVRTLACGYRFTLTGHPRQNANREYLITEAIHQLQIETEYNLGELEETALGERVTLDPKKNPDPYRCTFRAQPAREPYRHPYRCPRPTIPGLQTAVVTGPKGEEIYTDEYGRVKVQFHWDREGRKDEKTTCWIRKAEPWTGKNWGMVWVPRIGQEVVVQFEEGDPDRPMIVGMLFNEATKHPYALPGSMTMMGWTTRSTKKGGKDTFHELVFEDKKGEEFVRFQSERDYKQIVKNNAEVTVGLEHKDKGDYSLTVQNDMTETVNEGNHTFTVSKGQEDYSVKKDRNVTVEGAHNESITKDQTVKVQGAQTTKVSRSITTQAMQSITLKANQKITLQCGGSKIELSPVGVKVNGTMITVDGKGVTKVSGAMVDLKGKGILKAMGALLKLN